MVAWGAGSLYLFSTGVGELLQVNHEMTEVLTKGGTTAISEPTPPIQIHVGWRLVLGTASLGLAQAFFRRHYRGGRGF